MTPEEIEQAYRDWEKSSGHDPIESGDNYYWAGASAFREFLVNVSKKMKEILGPKDSM